jgi:SAM-dependent methyltransferase
MTRPESDKAFTGSIPAIYDAQVVPMFFQPYAVDLVRRLRERRPGRVLELAVGSGILTRTMASALPADVPIVATDLNQAMLDHAASIGTDRPVEWRQADAMHLPFPDASFDVVVCQFGVMFFPDKVGGFAEARRVLAPGGLFLFNSWDRLEENELAHAVTLALEPLFPDDPPRFMARVPHGYHDRGVIAGDLTAAGFAEPALMETVPGRSRAASARDVAVGICQGTPVRHEIEARDAARLEEATDAAAAYVAARFGAGPIDALMQAHVIGVAR